MAAICRPTEATYVIHDRVTAETSDNQDHTFCGIMFPVKCKDLLPLDRVIINSVAVRGRLGPVSVWVSNEDGDNLTPQNKQFRMHPRYWTKIYQKTHCPSFRTFCKLDLSSNPIVLKPGQVRAIYIHSTLPGDEAIVYDNRHQRRSYDDALVSVLTGRAHVSEEPFGRTPIWGWGNPWRDNREFVGRLEFGAIYKLWNPTTKDLFGDKFQSIVRTLFLCQRRWESPMSKLPDDCIFYILNMCRWDWAGDGSPDMKELRKRRRARFENNEAAQITPAATATTTTTTTTTASSPTREGGGPTTPAAAAAAAAAVASVVPATAETTTTTTSTSSCCTRLRGGQDDAQDTIEDQGADDENDGQAQEEAEEEDEKYVDGEEDDDDDDDEDSDDEEEGELDEYGILDDDEEELEVIDSDEWDDDDDSFAGEAFRYRDDDSDEEEDDGDNPYGADRRAWIRRQFARIHVLQAFANLEEQGMIEMNF